MPFGWPAVVIPLIFEEGPGLGRSPRGWVWRGQGRPGSGGHSPPTVSSLMAMSAWALWNP